MVKKQNPANEEKQKAIREICDILKGTIFPQYDYLNAPFREIDRLLGVYWTPGFHGITIGPAEHYVVFGHYGEGGIREEVPEGKIYATLCLEFGVARGLTLHFSRNEKGKLRLDSDIKELDHHVRRIRDHYHTLDRIKMSDSSLKF